MKEGPCSEWKQRRDHSQKGNPEKLQILQEHRRILKKQEESGEGGQEGTNHQKHHTRGAGGQERGTSPPSNRRGDGVGPLAGRSASRTCRVWVLTSHSQEGRGGRCWPRVPGLLSEHRRSEMPGGRSRSLRQVWRLGQGGRDAGRSPGPRGQRAFSFRTSAAHKSTVLLRDRGAVRLQG